MVDRIAPALRPNAEGIADLAITADGNLEMVTNAEAVGQHARQRVMTFEGEWFLDTTCGVPWLEQIMGRQFDEALATSVLKRELMETDGVTGIEAFSMRFLRRSRGVDVVQASLATEYDREVSL